MNCPRPHCGGPLDEIDDVWLRCQKCGKPARRSGTAAPALELHQDSHERSHTMAKDAEKCPVKYCRNQAATCEKHAGGGTRNPLQRLRAHRAGDGRKPQPLLLSQA